MILRIKLTVLFLGLTSIFIGAWGLISESLPPGQSAAFVIGGIGGLFVFTLCLPLLRLRLFRSLERTLAGTLEESSPSPRAYFNKLGIVPPEGKLGRFRLRRLGALRMLERPAVLVHRIRRLRSRLIRRLVNGAYSIESKLAPPMTKSGLVV